MAGRHNELTGPAATRPELNRRTLLIGGAVATGLAATGVIGYALAPSMTPKALQPVNEPSIPDAPEGVVTLERVESRARGISVDLFTAVPAGHGDGAGLPVVIILHGATGRPADYRGQRFGFGHFVSQAVADGAPPFVLAGATGDRLQWEPSGADDPRQMVVDEMPRWLDARGFDASRRAVWGWSMGGYGALRLAQTHPDFARATAVFSPAISAGDAVFGEVGALVGDRTGIWCGTEDSFYEATRDLIAAMASPPAVASFSTGAHTRRYWNSQLLPALAFLASRLG